MSYTFVAVFLSVCVLGFETPRPTVASPADCSALREAIPNDVNCVISNSCTRLRCSTSAVPFYPIDYNVIIHKCHHPVQVTFDVAATDFRWSHTFEGNETVPISGLPDWIRGLAGDPYAHVEMSRTLGGIVLSAALWFKKNGKWTTDEIPIVQRHKIPFDTSDCSSTGYYSKTSPTVYKPTEKFASSFSVGDSTTSNFILSELLQDPVVKKCLSQLKQGTSIDDWITDSGGLSGDLQACYCHNRKATSYGTLCKSSSDNGSSDTKWYIIGGCVGGTIVLVVVVAIIVFTICMKRRVSATAGVSYRELSEEC
ncbi:uncharacterized protein LOC134186865 isoform X2 [Corticium candelabrum]|uniref:uncharacterized protein LOC134186865 isoform X2 n=1 Tax=Corticium candelabrum TaxID=121492 RepID=UPI002E25FE0D|nr:uncharacterized protein LOC134186865 isoform X2 [Corticium candelabrum]